MKLWTTTITISIATAKDVQFIEIQLLFGHHHLHEIQLESFHGVNGIKRRLRGTRSSGWQTVWEDGREDGAHNK